MLAQQNQTIKHGEYKMFLTNIESLLDLWVKWIISQIQLKYYVILNKIFYLEQKKVQTILTMQKFLQYCPKHMHHLIQ